MKLLLLFFCATVLSCNRNKEKEKLLADFDWNIKYSNYVVSSSTDNILASFESKKQDPRYRANVDIWFPHVKTIHNYCKNFLTITEIKNEEEKQKMDWIKIVLAFQKLKDSILSIDTEITKEFYSTITPLKIFKDSSIQIKDQSLSIQYMALHKLKNTVVILENKLIAFCHSKIDVIILDCNFPNAFVYQNKSYFKKGEKLHIKAGIVKSFSYAQPKIIIRGQEISTKGDDYVDYSIRVNNKPGKYTIPLSLSFTDQNGLQQTKTKYIEYYVEK
jgi:hypothetical protein